jgi:hypothetical protein
MSSSSAEPIAARSPAENCARIKKLGYIVGKHVDLYGERTIELPVTLLSGWEDLFEEPADPTASELPAQAPLPEAAG